MTLDELRLALAQPSWISETPFQFASELVRHVTGATPGAGQELVLRALEVRSAFGSCRAVIDGLARKAGLFPYLDPNTLTTADQFAYEFHRPLGLDDFEIVFHRVQAEVYRELLDRRSVVLSAPTSFGKSLIIDAVIALERFKKIVVVVPTIALIDETRRRLARFSPTHKVITHPTQEPGERTVYVLTQERVVEGLDLEGTDFFVIDEFYKLQPSGADVRSAILNHAFYKLARTGAQFYMLGPNIRGIPEGFRERFKCTFIHTDYQTVVSERTQIQARGRRELESALIDLAGDLLEPTLVYCSSPARVRRVVKALLEAGIGELEPTVAPAVGWIGSNYHPDWLFPRGLEKGIAYHHGRLPRALSEMAVRAFNDGAARFLVCTSTLIEGVNTKAKNVVVFDNKLARSKLDYFTFNNIVGRSGRMFKHFVGRVYLFHEAPEPELPIIDIPVFTQSDDASEMLLLQMEEEDLTGRSRERLAAIVDQDVLPMDLMRENSGIDPQHQIELAEHILSDGTARSGRLAWRGMPRYEELHATCDLIHRFFVRSPRRMYGVASGRQLTYLVNRFLRQRSARAIIEEELRERGSPTADDADEVVELVLEFLRYWASYNFPRYLRALDRIQRHVLDALGLPTGDYSVLATQIENFFLDPAVFALDEYGIPIEIGQKLEEALEPGGDLDVALQNLRSLDLAALDLTPFERQLVREAVALM